MNADTLSAVTRAAVLFSLVLVASVLSLDYATSGGRVVGLVAALVWTYILVTSIYLYKVLREDRLPAWSVRGPQQ